MKSIFIISIVLVVFIAPTGAQTTEPSIVIDGEVAKSLALTLNRLEKFPTAEVKAKDHDGKEHTFKGTLLSIVLDSAGVTMGKQLRGKNLLKYVLVKASDGYAVVYTLAEIDPDLTSNTILLATRVDGNTLPKGEGPFRMIVPQDKRGARWIREIVSISVVTAK